MRRKLGFLRNHFYNHAFKNETLLKVADARKIVDGMCRVAERQQRLLLYRLLSRTALLFAMLADV